MMKCDVRPQARRHMLSASLLCIIAVVLAAKATRIRSHGHGTNGRHNPQDFYAWASNASFSYSFRYDPRAADEWLFHSGAWLFGTSMLPQTAARPNP